MMRKMLSLLLALVMLLSLGLAETVETPEATEVPEAVETPEITWTTYTFDEIGVSVVLPDLYDAVLTRNMDENDPAFAKLGLTKAQVDQIMQGGQSYLDAIVMTMFGVSEELVLTSTAFPMLESLDIAEDADVQELIGGMKASYEAQGVTILETRVYRDANSHVWALMFQQTTQGVTGLQCMTIQNSAITNLTVTNYYGMAITDDDVAAMCLMLDNMVFSK